MQQPRSCSRAVSLLPGMLHCSSWAPRSRTWQPGRTLLAATLGTITCGPCCVYSVHACSTDLHCFCVNVGLQGIVAVGQLWQLLHVCHLEGHGLQGFAVHMVQTQHEMDCSLCCLAKMLLHPYTLSTCCKMPCVAAAGNRNTEVLRGLGSCRRPAAGLAWQTSSPCTS